MKKVAFIGIDGADINILRELSAIGHLSSPVVDDLRPINLNSLDRGWATIFTGKDASYNNGFYWRIDNKTYSLTEIFNANMYTSSPIWNDLGSASKLVGLIGIPTISPISPLNGIAIAAGGGGVNMADSVMCYPAELASLLKENEYVFDLRFSDFVGKKAVHFVQKLRSVEEKRFAIFKILFKRYPDIVFWAMIFMGADRIQHFFWDRIIYLMKNSEYRDSLDKAIIDYYKFVFNVVAELVEMFAPGTVVIGSDHGFAGYTRNVHILNILADAGLVSLRKISLKSQLKKTVIRLLPDSIKPRMRIIQKKISMQGVWKLSAPECEWGKSLVVPFKGLNGIYLNTYKNFSSGIIDEQQASVVLEKTKNVLSSILDPESGHPLFINIQFREEVYSGPQKDNAPDIIFDLPKGYMISSEVSSSGNYVTQHRTHSTKPNHMPGQGHIGIHSVPACYGVYENGSVVKKNLSNLSELHKILYNNCMAY